MKLTITSEFRFYRTPDGLVWTPSSFEYSFWIRYLNVFDEVMVAARVLDVKEKEAGWKQSCGDNVTFHKLPYYVGIKGLIMCLPKLFSSLRQLSKQDTLFLLRVPSQTATLLTLFFARKINFALEVVGDPYDVFDTGIGGRWLAPILKHVSAWILRRQCKKAVAVSYVTSKYLQSRYPTEAFQSNYSSIMLPKHYFTAAKTFESNARKVIFIGSLNQLYKAPDVLLKAFAPLCKQDPSWQLTMIGSGCYLEEMKKLAESLNIDEHINFLGEIPANEVAAQLEKHDLFVLPSRTEGLPRAMIEAMAKGLPCIGTRVGGIPELISPDCIVEANDIEALSETFSTIANNPGLLTQLSKQNFSTAHQYEDNILIEKRTQFYRHLNEVRL